MSDTPSLTQKLPYHGPCFICGPDNPDGLGKPTFHVEHADLLVPDE